MFTSEHCIRGTYYKHPTTLFDFSIVQTSSRQRCASHLQSFNDKYNEKDTELSKHFWRIKDSNFTTPFIWNIKQECLPSKLQIKKCHLCLNQIIKIASYTQNNLLNKKTKLITKCHHQNEYTPALWLQGLGLNLYLKEFLDALLNAKVSYSFICFTPKTIWIAENSSYAQSLSKTSSRIDVILVVPLNCNLTYSVFHITSLIIWLKIVVRHENTSMKFHGSFHWQS